MKTIITALALLASTAAAHAHDWHEGDIVNLNIGRTFACTSAPVFRELYRMINSGREDDAMRFGVTYCQISVWAPVPLVVMYGDDFSGERNPGVCVRQMNWRDCYWIAREQLVPFNSSARQPGR